MPRLGITEAQMEAAVEALLARNESVTKITLRRELGDTGSFGTISAFLARRRERQQVDKEPIPVTPIPEGVQQQFSLTWSQARAEAQAELVRERQIMAAESAELRQSCAAAQAENEEAVRTLEVQLAGLAQQVSESAAKVQASQDRIAEQAERTGYLMAQLEAAQKAQKATEALMSGVKFWIWSNRKKAWWTEGRRGHTKQRKKAGLYTLSDLQGACIEDLEMDDIPALRDVLIVKEGLRLVDIEEG